MQNELNFVINSSRVGISCDSAGSILLGREGIGLPNPLSVSELRRDPDGCCITGSRAYIQVGSKSWLGLLEQSFLKPGLELDVVNAEAAIVKAGKINTQTSLYPSVVAESGVNPILIVSTPKDRPRWDENISEQELARLALRRLVSKESGFELQHMLTMVLRSLLTGEERELSLEDGAHDTHHSQANAKSAISRNFLKGSSKLGLLTLGKNAGNNQWLVVNHNGEELVPSNVSTKLSTQEEVQILSNGIAVAVNTIILSGITKDNPDIKQRDIGAALIDTALSLTTNYQKSAGDLSSRLLTKLRSTKRI